MSVDDVELEVWAGDLSERLGWVGSYESVTLHPRHNAQPTGSVRLATDDPKVALLSVPGVRLVARFRGEQVMSGPVRTRHGQAAGPASSVTCEVADDWRLLRRLLGWPVPDSAITSQDGAEYAVYTGPAETVVKQIIAENLARVPTPQPITIATDQGRGDTITVQVRMHLLADRLLPLIDQAGIGVTVQQDGGNGLVVDCYESGWWPLALSEEAGTVAAAEWSSTAPTLTRVVVGGPGEGTDRVFGLYADTDLEDEYQDVIEGFVDARDIRDDDPNFEDLMEARAAEALAEGAPRSGLSLALAESTTFRYGADGVRVGDLVTVQLDTGATVTDVLREATLTHSPDNGVDVTPLVGENPGGEAAIARAIAALTRSVRNLHAGR